MDLRLDFQLCFDLRSLAGHSILPHSSFFLVQLFPLQTKQSIGIKNKEYSILVAKQNIYLCFERKRIYFILVKR